MALYLCNSRMPPLDVLRSIKGPPVPMTPSRRLRLISPCVLIEKSVVTEELDVRATTRALVLSGKRSVMPPLLVLTRTSLEKWAGKVSSTLLLEVSARTERSARASEAWMPPFEVEASNEPARRSAWMCPFEEWAVASPSTFSSSMALRSEEHTSELQSLRHLVCR